MKDDVFIGMGNNPQGPNMPLGFGMLLEGEPIAKENYRNLAESQKNELIQYMQQAKTGQDSEYRVVKALQKLKENQINQLIGIHEYKHF